MKVHVYENNWVGIMSEKSRQAKNGGAEGGSWWERGFQREAGEESVKVAWTRGKNGRDD